MEEELEFTEEELEEAEEEEQEGEAALREERGEASPFGRYLSQISQYENPSVEEEARLGRLAAAGDLDARNELVVRFLRLVVSLAKKYAGLNHRITIDDLVSSGNVGLVEAANKFDPDKGYRFSTYASCWIRRELIRTVRDEPCLIAYPENMIEDMSAVRQAVGRLSNVLQRKPTMDEITRELSGRMDKDRCEFVCATMMTKDVVSFDRPVILTQGREASCLGSIAADNEGQSPKSFADDRLTDDVIYEAMGDLNPVERFIIIHRYGLFGNPQMTLEATADALKDEGLLEKRVSRERIRQLEFAGLRKLKKNKKLKSLAN